MSRFVELAHVLEDGMPSYPGLPPAHFGSLLTHEESRARYLDRAEFFLGKADFPSNVGTYIDVPFHRYRDGADLSEVPLAALAGLPGLVVESASPGRELVLDGADPSWRGRAVLVRTGWDDRWGTDAYWEPGPFLGARAIEALVRARPALVGVDFANVDDVEDLSRPAHTRLLAEGILIVEHLRLAALPAQPFRFFAVPPRVVRGASFPVRAFAELES